MLLSLLENAGNRVFEIDPDSLERVAELEGRTIALEVRHLGKRFVLRPGRHGISLESGTRVTADVTLIAAPSVFARIAAQGLDDVVYTPGELEIQGDALLAQRFARILGDLDIDWEELLAQQTGDIPARFISRQVGAALSWAQETRQVMKQNMAEYLVEEARIVASSREVDKFLGDVDNLRADINRLEARLVKIRQALEEKTD
jgi:ubiquinone biosynthesis protein UbiJ